MIRPWRPTPILLVEGPTKWPPWAGCIVCCKEKVIRAISFVVSVDVQAGHTSWPIRRLVRCDGPIRNSGEPLVMVSARSLHGRVGDRGWVLF